MIYDTRKIDALVLAGGINRIALFDGYTPGYKGLLPLRGKPLIQYTLDALRNSPAISRICIVGPVGQLQENIAEPRAYEFVQSAEDLIDNITRGLEKLRRSPIVLVTTSDLPLLSSLSVQDFLETCSRLETHAEASLFWSMVPEECFTGNYAQVNKGFNRFADVSVCHGNLLLLTPAIIDNKRFLSRMNRIYLARKSSIRAALAIGPVVGLTYLVGVHQLRILTMTGFSRIVSSAFGIGLIPVLMHDPDIAVDIDEPRDYRFIMNELDRRGGNMPGGTRGPKMGIQQV
jgi:GTP:adenosylcobinamide-phosphate guanylyltransferase